MNWNKITLNKYSKMTELLNQEMEDIDLNMNLVAVINDLDVEEVYNMDINTIKEYLEGLSFIQNKYEAKTPESHYKIGDREYEVFFNVNKMTAAQYIDFQSFYKEYDKYTANLAACFLLPKGKKYAQDYDPMEEAEYFKDHLTIDIFSDIMFFFVKLLNLSTMDTLHSSEKEMKKKLKKTKNKKERMAILRRLIQTRQLILLLQNGAELSE